VKPVRPDVAIDRGASALVLSGELTEGVSDMAQAMTAPGGVPALREVNQDRSHPDTPLIEEQPHASYRRVVESGSGGPGGGPWRVLNPGIREGHVPHPGPATQTYRDHLDQSASRTTQSKAPDQNTATRSQRARGDSHG
jgi:hypothetical protein